MDTKVIKLLGKHDFYYNPEDNTIETLDHTKVMLLRDDKVEPLEAFTGLKYTDKVHLINILDNGHN